MPPDKPLQKLFYPLCIVPLAELSDICMHVNVTTHCVTVCLLSLWLPEWNQRCRCLEDAAAEYAAKSIIKSSITK